ncbi:MAG: ZIP family metal transporter [Nanoarchaeota archaeon]|nr:ZIP family metal transporter [Nanoarchaeota archaeon]
MQMIFWVFLSVIIVSCISFVGVVSLVLSKSLLHRLLLYMVGFSAGALLGDAFLHLLPESVESLPIVTVSLVALLGIVVSFAVEKFVQWRHVHHADVQEIKEHGHKVFASMNLIGDAVHNFIDGMIIAGSYLVSFPLGLSTTFAVALHEIPQEVGDFAVLLHGGLKLKKALWFNFLSGMTAILGAAVALLLRSAVENISVYLSSFAIGGFIYIAATDLIPELHKERYSVGSSSKQLIALMLGMVVMAALLWLE